MALNPNYCSAFVTSKGCSQGGHCKKRHDIGQCECGLVLLLSNFQRHRKGKGHRTMLSEVTNSQQQPQPAVTASAAVSALLVFGISRTFSAVSLNSLSLRLLELFNAVHIATETYQLPKSPCTLRNTRANSISSRHKQLLNRLNTIKTVSTCRT